MLGWGSGSRVEVPSHDWGFRLAQGHPRQRSRGQISGWVPAPDLLLTGAQVSGGPPPTDARQNMAQLFISTTGFFPRRSGRTPPMPGPSSSDRGPERGRVDGAAVFPQQPRGRGSPGPQCVRQLFTSMSGVSYVSLDQQHSFLVKKQNSVLWHRNDFLWPSSRSHSDQAAPDDRAMDLLFPGKGA